jgi:tRNA(adenine34) deaminase
MVADPQNPPIPADPQEDLRWMNLALEEARAAAEAGEVPVGAVVVAGGRILGRGRNQNETLQDPTAHAEILAITAAANTVGSWRLEGASLYVTLEPCLMCAGAIFLARIQRLVYATPDPKRGALGSVIDVSTSEALNHHTEVERGPLDEESSRLLKAFFEKLRRNAQTTDRDR